MSGALLRRALMVPVTLVGVSLLTFVLVHLAPGDPALVRAGAGTGVTDEVIARDRALAGLDRPLLARYGEWIARSARLDFGASLVDGRPVRERVAEALPRTLALGLVAAIFAFALGIALGLALAALSRSPTGRVLEWSLALLYGVPVVALALLLVRAGAPLGGGGLVALLAPAACLALPSVAALARQERAALLAALRSGFVLGARARGADRARVLALHALPVALLPMVALAGAEVPSLLSGSVLVERVFGVAGLGSLGLSAVATRDYPLLLGLVTVVALLTVGGQLLADLALLALDPRRRDAESRP